MLKVNYLHKNRDINLNAFFGGTQGSSKPCKKKYFSKFPFKCYNCGLRGHKSECIKKKENKRANIAEEDKLTSVTCLSNEKVEKAAHGNLIKLVVDPGCTNHLITSEFEKV